MRTSFRNFALASVAILSLMMVSCKSDEEKGFDISGLYGKIWVADLGEISSDGYPIYSEFEFIAGSYSDHGVGREVQYYADNDELYQRLNFDWFVENGNLILKYGYNDYLYLYNLITYSNYFSAYVEEDKYRTEFHHVAGRAADGDEMDSDQQNVRQVRKDVVFKVKQK